MNIPRATYRLQFNAHFRLVDALKLVPYLHDLGVSHLYSSPLLKPVPNSLHGYDVCDFNQLNPELGSEADLVQLVNALHQRNMGFVLDIVPNHMGIMSRENAWWWDVLTHGMKSRFAAHFDVDWNPPDKDSRGKVLVPILGDEYDKLLEKGEFQLLFENRQLVLGYHDHRLPLSPETVEWLPTNGKALQIVNSSAQAMDKLIRQQNYRLAFWEDGDLKLNYRRFFAVSSLAAVRVEDEAIFEATHVLIRRWIDEGLIDGLRVDHPDGLRDPATYLKRLRKMAPDAWIVVEKILGSRESLPVSWPVQGTTGYDFLNQVNDLFIDAEGEKKFTDIYAAFAGESMDYAEMLHQKKRLVLENLLAAELNRLVDLLVGVAARNTIVKEFSDTEIRECLIETITCYPVYRSYIREDEVIDAADIAVIKFAVQLACERRQDLPQEIFAFLHALLIKPQNGAKARDFVSRFQQLTGPVMAKGAEDTAFYCFNRFASLNEVGGNPNHFGGSLQDFHKYQRRQQQGWPMTQLTTSTHDTKRGEDVRSRLNVLSEIPELWEQAVLRWSTMNAGRRQGEYPDRNAEYLFYQTLVGAWPISEDRALAYMEKASREAKEHTDWTKPNQAYDQALRKFISDALHDSEFISDLERFVGRLKDAAAINSLGQTLIKLTAPGVPDIYQGCELWDFSLVDPDNRRPVDFVPRMGILKTASAMAAEPAWEPRADGLPKLWLIQKTLKLRAQIPEYSQLSYVPMLASGAKENHIIAFSRGGRTITVVPRFLLKLDNNWQDTELKLPPGAWRNEFTGEIFKDKATMTALIQKFPVALLVREEKD